MSRISILIRGRVQGVFFRASAREAALQFDVRGFVRNQPDGSVYIEAEGEEQVLNQFIAWCHKGPPRAAVSDVDVQKIEGAGYGYDTSFEIRR